MSVGVRQSTTMAELSASIPNIGQRRLMFQNRYLDDGTIASNGIGEKAVVYVDSNVSRYYPICSQTTFSCWFLCRSCTGSGT